MKSASNSTKRKAAVRKQTVRAEVNAPSATIAKAIQNGIAHALHAMPIPPSPPARPQDIGDPRHPSYVYLVTVTQVYPPPKS